MFLPKSVESSREALRHSSPKDFDTSDAKQTPRTVPDSSFSESAIDDYASSPALVDEYRISAREVEQRVLPPVVDAGAAASCPGYTPGLTKIFAYGTVTSNGKSTHSWPAYTIEARRNRPVKVDWVNELYDLTTKQFKKHLLKGSIDQTIHWANPAGKPGNGPGAIDSSPCMTCSVRGDCANDATCVKAATQTSYEGPVPLVTHLHGHNMAFDFSDGYPEAWFMPDAADLGSFTPVGTWYDTFMLEAAKRVGDVWAKGSATFTYLNVQKPTQMWYHDHVVGLTRLNVYAGLAGLYHLRDVDIAKGPELPGMPWPPPGVGFPDSEVREVPLLIQDRVWDINSQLFYPKNDLNKALVQPNGPVPPKWIPEFLGITVDGAPIESGAEGAATMVVNGNTWPRFDVTREPYRLRLLNGCNARVLSLYFSWVPAHMYSYY